MKELQKKEKLIPKIPQNFRSFIEAAIKDERVYYSFLESPLTTMKSYGIEIRPEAFNIKYVDRIAVILTKVRKLHLDKAIAKDFKFEDVFDVVGPRAGFRSDSSSSWGENTKFDASDPSSTWSSSTNNRVHNDFNGIDFTQIQTVIQAPLIDHVYLDNIITQLETLGTRF